MTDFAETVYSCGLEKVWIWRHGYLGRDKMRGAALKEREHLDAEVDVEQILRGKVRHGWVVTVAGDTSGCGWDMTTYFLDHEPVVTDGRTMTVTTYEENDDGDEVEVPAEVVDGPHEATWLEVGE